MSSLRVDETLYPFEQLCIPLEKLDLPLWLAQQTLYPKVYWKDKDSSTLRAACGAILSFEQPPILDSAFDVRLYGGMHFVPPTRDALWGLVHLGGQNFGQARGPRCCGFRRGNSASYFRGERRGRWTPRSRPKTDRKGEQGPLWEAFPSSAFWLPEFEVVQSQENTHLLLNFVNKEPSMQAMHALCWDVPCTEEFLMHLMQERDCRPFVVWKEQIDRVLSSIAEKQLQKVVLARKKELLFSQRPCCWKMLKRLQVQNATLFAFQFDAHSAFFGASPERLFHRIGNRVSIDAVAGTRRRGNSQEEENALANELHCDEKEMHEFGTVKEYIEEALRPFAARHQWHNQDQILKTNHVQHLYNCASFQLKEQVSDRALIEALHPTPALGGYPKKRALECLLQCEPFERGWYGSPVGWISPRESYFSVAIRSALLKDVSLHVFAGAGIVASSQAIREWEEIDHKMRVICHGCGIAK